MLAVKEANDATASCVFLALCFHATGRDFVYENPKSSFLRHVFEVKRLLEVTGGYTEQVLHGLFGTSTGRTASIKPLTLMGTARWLPRLAARSFQLSRKMGKGWLRKTLAISDDLSESEHYSPEFSKAVARIMHPALVDF